MDSVNLRAVGLMGSSEAALEELESLPTRDSMVKHFLLCWNIVMGYLKKKTLLNSRLNQQVVVNHSGVNPRLKKKSKR